jgi:uncharacterized protein
MHISHASANSSRAEPSGLRIEQLLTAEAYPHPVAELSLRETHLSWVILTGEYAYKIKKPIRFEFVDFSTLELRHRCCEAELQLNCRLAPQLYLDVVAIAHGEHGLQIGGDGTPVEYAVRMRQFPAGAELAALLATDQVSTDEITTLAELLARFHLLAPLAAPDADTNGTQQLLEAVLGNLSQLLAQLGPAETPPPLHTLIGWCHDQALAHEPDLMLREQAGFIRDCHGDLHGGNIVRFGSRLLPFDCIEFNAALRHIDVMNDLAFLVMDLRYRGHTDLALVLLSRYLEVTGDYEGVELLPFYCVYRALVRAKIDALSVHQQPQRASIFQARLEQRIQAAIDWTTPREPTLALMHGPSGSGKSWLSNRLVATLPAIRIRSDVERKRLAGIGADESAAAPVAQGVYSAHFSHRTYARLADCAERCLRAGFSVIVDAAFLDSSDREIFQKLAQHLRVGFAIASCQADPITLASRILQRGREHPDPSDANLAVLDAQLRNLQPFSANEEPHVIAIDTAQDIEVAQVRDAIVARCRPPP